MVNLHASYDTFSAVLYIPDVDSSICIHYLHKMHKYKLFLPVLLPRIRLNYSKNWCHCTNSAKLQTEMTSHNALQYNTRCQIWGSIPQLLILIPEMHSEKFSNLGAHSTEWAHSQDLTLFLFCCVHHHRSILTKDQLCNADHRLLAKTFKIKLKKHHPKNYLGDTGKLNDPQVNKV